MRVLGIETSCDETSAAVVENGVKILSNVISSQNDIHAKYGGVIPELASRRHLECIVPVVKESLDKANVSLKNIDAVAVTYGPGLVGALLVGIEFGKAIAFSLDKPIIGINHLEGHLFATVLEHGGFGFLPAVCIVVSGGHTELILWKNLSKYEFIAKTRDDAAGEAFDKVAKLLGLDYPGGPEIEKLAKTGDDSTYKLPIARMKDKSLDFSFSGLKTSVVNLLKHTDNRIKKDDLSASFQKAVVDSLVNRVIEASLMNEVDNIVLSGGVAANTNLRNMLVKTAKENRKNVFFPSKALCTDNAAMIASAAYYRFKNNEKSGFSINAEPNMRLV